MKIVSGALSDTGICCGLGAVQRQANEANTSTPLTRAGRHLFQTYRITRLTLARSEWEDSNYTAPINPLGKRKLEQGLCSGQWSWRFIAQRRPQRLQLNL